jgi:ABC-type nitrate/sulfonate/bicarbonate transport system permease component
VLLAIWELVIRAGWYTGLFFPAPSAIARALGDSLANGQLWLHLSATLLRIAGGLAIGGLAGLLLGLAMGSWRGLRTVVDPIIAAIHPVPKLALFPLLIVLLGIGERSKIASVSVGAFFPMVLNTLAGVRSISPVHLDLARNYGASTWKLFSRVLLPGSLPMILTGLRLSANVAFHATIGVEMVGSRIGLGSLVWLSWQTFRIEQLYATVTVIALVGLGITMLLRGIARRSAPWLPEYQLEEA